MAKLFDVAILTPAMSVYQGRASSLVAPGAMGYLGILANHAPLITTLGPGKVSLKESSGKTRTFKSTGNGYLEVLRNSAVLLLDSAA